MNPKEKRICFKTIIMVLRLYIKSSYLLEMHAQTGNDIPGWEQTGQVGNMNKVGYDLISRMSVIFHNKKLKYQTF